MTCERVISTVGSQLMNVFRKTDAEKTNSYCNNSYRVIEMVKYHRMEQSLFIRHICELST